MRFDKLKIIIGVALVIFVFLSAVIIVSGLLVDKAVKQNAQNINGNTDNLAAIIDNKTKNNSATISSVVNTPVSTTPTVDNTPAANPAPVVDTTPQPAVVTPQPVQPAPMMSNPPMRRTRAS